MNQVAKKKVITIGSAIAITYFILVVLNIVLIQPNVKDIFNITELYKGIEFVLCFGFGLPVWGASVIMLSFVVFIYTLVLLTCKRIGK